MKVLHLTPEGPGSGVTRPERRVAWALVRETIRHELAERHAAHWPRYRPSSRRRLAAHCAARRRGLVVVTDHDGAGRRVLAAATYRTTSAQLGRLAAVPLRVLRCCTKGTMILVTMILLLALRDGRIGIGALFAIAVTVAIVTAPAVSIARERLGDRVVAGRAALLVPARSGEPPLLVLHQLGFPQRVEQRGTRVDPTGAVARALRARDGARRLAQPCCAELAAQYGRCEGVEWTPRHADVSRMVLIFLPTGEVEQDRDTTSVVSSLEAYRNALERV